MYFKSNIRYPLFKILALLQSIFLLSLNCAGSIYQKAETLYGENKFQELTSSDLDCHDTTTPCFRLKYLKMESYMQLDDWQHALRTSQEAISRLTPEVPLEQANRVFQLRTELTFKRISELESGEKVTSLLRSLETDLYRAVALNKDSAYAEQVSEYQLWLTKALLRKMDYHEGKNLEIIHEDITDLISEYDERLVTPGYNEYYRLQADIKLYLPEIRNWIYKAQISRDREELLLRLKSIYKDALHLRKIPLYQQGYAEEIEAQLKELDDYMKQLII